MAPMTRPQSNFSQQPIPSMPSGNMPRAPTSFTPPALTKPSFPNQSNSNLPSANNAAQIPFGTPTNLTQPTSVSGSQMNGHQSQIRQSFPQMNGPSRPQNNSSIPPTSNEQQPSGIIHYFIFMKLNLCVYS